MVTVKVQWLDAPVLVPALDRIVRSGDELDMDEVEARDREAAGQVRIVKATKSKSKGEE